MNHSSIRNIALLGSTGSIGTQTLDIVREHPDLFNVVALTAGHNWQLLAAQAREFKPLRVAIADERFLPQLREALSDLLIEVEGGARAIADIAAMKSAGIVVTALVGYSGLIPTVKAIKAGKTVALANKETLVAGGAIIDSLLKAHQGARLIPVDSEHSAIFQCLAGETTLEARKIWLTASGGPFRTLPASDLRHVTPADALRHPNWNMGAKVTIDSASMMNKGFEMIEAHWLFGCPPDKIDILVHPQSIVHSMVEFNDGSVKAQLGTPDMHLPIRYALSWPRRLTSDRSPLRLEQFTTLTFEAPDFNKFPLLGFAFEAIRLGGNMGAILNAANEVAVQAFLTRRIRFTDMPRLAERVMASALFVAAPTLEDIIETHKEATELSLSIADELEHETLLSQD